MFGRMYTNSSIQLFCDVPSIVTERLKVSAWNSPTNTVTTRETIFECKSGRQIQLWADHLPAFCNPKSHPLNEFLARKQQRFSMIFSAAWIHFHPQCVKSTHTPSFTYSETILLQTKTVTASTTQSVCVCIDLIFHLLFLFKCILNLQHQF